VAHGVETTVVGRVDYLDRSGRRLILGGLAFTMPVDLDLTGIFEGAVVKLRYDDGPGRRLVLKVQRIGRPPNG
jgi:hypothetical protein